MSLMVLALAAITAAQATPPPPADPLTAQIETGDADRFAALFERTGGRPTAEQLQRDYLDRGSYGVGVFTPNRIRDATNLAAAIAAKPDLYAKAIRTCLPMMKETTAELRATYLGLRGLFPDRALPRIYLVVGAGTSGGTAGLGAQVLGLETLCRIANTPDELRGILRGFYAHETVHALQVASNAEKPGGVLLNSVLREGAADFIAALVTGRQMDAARATWAAPREPELWQQFEADLAATRGKGLDGIERGTPAGNSYYRWVGNYSSAPDGWPSELGYWMGQRIWQRWYDRQSDKQVAVRAMLELKDPEGVLTAGRLVAQPQTQASVTTSRL